MRGITAILLAAVPIVLAQSCKQIAYERLPSFVEPNACVPGGYFQAQDLGNTNPSDLVTRCQAQCTAFGDNCQEYVGQLFKAADSNLYSGQCFFYNGASAPSSPRQCADYPTVILAEAKRTVLRCFSSSASVASVFCSSYLAIPIVTLTSTTTPIATATSTRISTIPRTASVTISTTTTTTSTTTTGTITTTSLSETTTTSTTTTTTTTRQIVASPNPPLNKRAVAPTPACLQATPAPSAAISSACSCLSVPTRTVTTTVAAATSTTTTGTTTTTLSTSTYSTTTTSVSVTLSTKTTTGTDSKTVTATSTNTQVIVAVQDICIPNGQPCNFRRPDQCCGQGCDCGPYPTCVCFQNRVTIGG